ncbi:MAG: AbrB/MazE/SpoVT family DNA-binding domain-containing protein [Nitrospinae bacterium]|nr:AbrB/MazE/SpoVT family DNA-binding domain-containing protein [Nitrospinota bacterium]
MKLAVTRIGNSRGVRIPKTVIEQVGLGDSAELEVVSGKIVISPAPSRKGWAEAFRKKGGRGEDGLLDEGNIPRAKWDDDEWEW